jgi:hypothetical protein
MPCGRHEHPPERRLTQSCLKRLELPFGIHKVAVLHHTQCGTAFSPTPASAPAWLIPVPGRAGSPDTEPPRSIEITPAWTLHFTVGFDATTVHIGGCARYLSSAVVGNGAGAVSGGQVAGPCGPGRGRRGSAGAAQDGRAFLRGEVIAGFQHAGQQLGLGGEGTE